ncbi:hypothetical protein J4461_00420 [Candidatus Pacearchaeota archaeon]|nr:hypothetical protein [Candidatus Pacearchaeota archaeon]
MKIAPYVEKLSNSQPYHLFIKDNSDAYMMAGFFVLDFESGNNTHKIDYYVPSKKKIAEFTLDKQVSVQLLSTLNSKTPEKLDIKTSIDLEAIKGILEEEMKNRNITEQIHKIIAVLQNLKGKKIWTLNCLLSGMGIIHASIEDSSKSVLKMEKASLLDYLKKVPAAQLMQSQPKQEQGQSLSEDDVKQEINKLEELEKKIEAEKQELIKEEKLGKKQSPKKKQAVKKI